MPSKPIRPIRNADKSPPHRRPGRERTALSGVPDHALRMKAGFAVGAALLAGALALSRSLPGAHAFIHIVLFAVPVAAALIVGGILPAAAALVVGVALARYTPLASGGALGYVEVACVDLLAIAALHGLRATRAAARKAAALASIVAALMEHDTTGIVVLGRSGRALHVSREAVRICGPDMKVGSGFEPIGSIRLTSPDGVPVTVRDLFLGLDPDHAPARRGAARGARDLLIVRDSEQRVWIQCRATPIAGPNRRPSLLLLLMWDNQTKRHQQIEAGLEDRRRRSREEREDLLQRISRRSLGGADASHIQLAATEELGAFLHADRCLFLLFRVGGHAAVVGPQWCAEGFAPAGAQDEPIEGLDIERLYRRGVTRISHDMGDSSVPAGIAAVFADRLGVRAAINVPLFQDSSDLATGALIVAMAHRPRAWTTDEIACVEAVASQTRFVIEAARLLAAERARAEREETASTIGNALRSTLEPTSIQREATGALGRALGADRCYYVSYDLGQNLAVVGPDFIHSPQLASLWGQYDLLAGALWMRELLGAQQILVVDDAAVSDPLHAAAVVAMKNEPVRSFIRVPILQDKTLVAALIVTMTHAPRTWSIEEVNLVESVAAQTRSAITNALLIARETAHARHEQLLNDITSRVGQAESVRLAHDAAVAAVGEALAVDRCYLLQIDRQRGIAVTAAQYHRPGLTAMVDLHPLSDPDLCWLIARLRSGEPFASSDIRRSRPESSDREAQSLFHVQSHRGLLAAPQIAGGEVDAVLIAAAAHRPRLFSDEEARLARDAAIHLRGALQVVTAHEEEHRVAVTLQEALLPEAQGDLPGLDIATHYRAALRESRIGGDFYDAFAIDSVRTAVCVGDVSGKGLTAAAQLAALRNMLRATVYRSPERIGSAVADLNQMIASHRLLSGFATLWVGVFDAEHRRLRYVSCGHEPAILVHSGFQTLLDATAAAIGVFEDEHFDEGEATLSPGDLLLLYTDGVSEIGKAAEGMLGAAGVARLLSDAYAHCGASAGAAEILRELTLQLDRRSAGVISDDMCLLLLRALQR